MSGMILLLAFCLRNIHKRKREDEIIGQGRLKAFQVLLLLPGIAVTLLQVSGISVKHILSITLKI